MTKNDTSDTQVASEKKVLPNLSNVPYQIAQIWYIYIYLFI